MCFLLGVQKNVFFGRMEVIPTWWLNWFHSDLPFFVQKSKKSKFHKTFTKKPYSCLVTSVFSWNTRTCWFQLELKPFLQTFFGCGGVCWKKQWAPNPNLQPPSLIWTNKEMSEIPNKKHYIYNWRICHSCDIGFLEVVNHLFNPCNVQTLTFHEILIVS